MEFARVDIQCVVATGTCLRPEKEGTVYTHYCKRTILYIHFTSGATQCSEVNTQYQTPVVYIYLRCYFSYVAFYLTLTVQQQPKLSLNIHLTAHRNISTAAQPAFKKMLTTLFNMLSTSTTCRFRCGLCRELASFLAACKPVFDLPFQNGNEEWPNFFAARRRLEDKNIDILDLLTHHEHPKTPEFLQSSLYEALFGPPPVIKPVTKFSSAGRSRQRVSAELTPTLFIKTSVDMNEEWHTYKSLTPISRKVLFAMAKQLYSKQVNLLDFLSSDLTDELLKATPFL